MKIFLPQIGSEQIDSLKLWDRLSDSIEVVPLSQDWQTSLCAAVGYPDIDLPWSKLRLGQFSIDKKVAFACCCDPVMMQLTHRGAYMLGQAPLQLSHYDAIRIVAQINERLMTEDECLYLIDKHAWLFTSNKTLDLVSASPQSLIGKDMFNFSYGGNHADYWKKLATEIQMLIKQMIDYQGLASTPAETMMNVHFHDDTQVQEKQEIPFSRNSSITVVSNNELIKSFCAASFLSHKDFENLAEVETDNVLIVSLDSEREIYPEIVRYWIQKNQHKRIVNSQIICQDSIIKLKSKPGFLKRIFKLN